MQSKDFSMKILWLPIVLLVFPIPSRAQDNGALSLRGTVTASGKSVNGAFVLLRDIESPSQEFVSKNWEMQTESDGHFSFVVQPGCYDLFVSSNDSLPFSKRMCVEAKNSVLEIKLQADRNPRLRIIDRF